MPLQNLNSMLAQAKQLHYAVPGFGICDSLSLGAVMRAAEARSAPVVLTYEERFSSLTPAGILAPALLAAAQLAPAAVCVQYQWARSLDEVAQALSLGFPAVMFDGSQMPFDQNVHFTRQAADMCRDANAACEGVLGNPDAERDPLTNVQQAADFVGETRVNSLAVAIGNHHRTFPMRPELNFAQLDALSGAVPVPLVLHGGSELSQEDIRSASAAGIEQINFWACMLGPALTAWRSSEGPYMEAAAEAQTATQTVADERITLTGCAGHSAG